MIEIAFVILCLSTSSWLGLHGLRRPVISWLSSCSWGAECLPSTSSFLIMSSVYWCNSVGVAAELLTCSSGQHWFIEPADEQFGSTCSSFPQVYNLYIPFSSESVIAVFHVRIVLLEHNPPCYQLRLFYYPRTNAFFKSVTWTIRPTGIPPGVSPCSGFSPLFGIVIPLASR